jgi:hypothetical protein
MIVAGVIILLIIVATFDYEAANNAYNEARTGSSSPSPSPSPTPAAATNKDGAVIQITGTPSKAPYSGSVGSASAGQHSVEGKLSEVPEGKPVKDYPVEIPVETNGNDVVTAVIQRQTDAPGGIIVKIVDSDGKTLKEGTTTASYGVVTVNHSGRF